LSVLICTAVMDKDYAQLYASMDRVIETYSGLDQKSYICYDHMYQKTGSIYKGKFCVNFVNYYLQFMFVTLFWRTVTYLYFLFRSRSYPVPHRGERVKQRMMQARY
jgi:hypothetical protein